MCMSRPYCDLVVIYPRPIFRWGMLPLEPKMGALGGGRNWTRRLISIENSFSFSLYSSFSSPLLLTHPDLSLTFSLSFLPCDAIFPATSVIASVTLSSGGKGNLG